MVHTALHIPPCLRLYVASQQSCSWGVKLALTERETEAQLAWEELAVRPVSCNRLSTQGHRDTTRPSSLLSCPGIFSQQPQPLLLAAWRSERHRGHGYKRWPRLPQLQPQPLQSSSSEGKVSNIQCTPLLPPPGPFPSLSNH